jgi:putative ABC transport system substrate-binding protein
MSDNCGAAHAFALNLLRPFRVRQHWAKPDQRAATLRDVPNSPFPAAALMPTSINTSAIHALAALVLEAFMLRARRQLLHLAAGAAALPAVSRIAWAQTSGLRRVGFLSSSVQTYQSSFRDGMRALGYVDGQNVFIEHRFADGNDDLLPDLAKQLVAAGVEMIVVTNSATTRAAMQATKSLPIIMVTSGDPVGSGFIQSFARPGGNVTGLSSFAAELSNKQLELLKDLKPTIARVAALANLGNDSNVAFFSQAQGPSGSLGVTLQPFDIRSAEDLQRALDEMKQNRPDGLLVLIDQFTISRRALVVKFANEEKLPAVYPLREFVLSGGLISYGCSFAHLHYRAATYVDKILKGSKPSDLPVELPTRFEVVINNRTASAFGLRIPTSVLLRVDEEVE